MCPVWLIEADVYGADAEPLLAEIRRQGMAGQVVPFQGLQKHNSFVAGGRPLADGDCVIGPFMG
jgi:hypothetical protein